LIKNIELAVDPELEEIPDLDSNLNSK